MKPFREASYLAQIKRLRELARSALKAYNIQVKELKFINHAENTTFRITAKGGAKYLLRIHRDDYHSLPAIDEELKWLARLSKDKRLAVPSPVRSKRGHWIEVASAAGVNGTRYCCVFRWIDGTFLHKSVQPKHLYEVGKILARLQKTAPRTRHRRYWTAEGLVGAEGKFGSIDAIPGLKSTEQRRITNARRQILAKLKRFERKFPRRQGLIHADLHFGNLLNLKSGLGAIDFDDCGFGFHAYDMAIPLMSAENSLGKKNRKRLPALREALISGYKTEKVWDAHDDKILDTLITARRLLMLGWLNSRSDNPELKAYLKTAVKRALKHLETSL